MPPEQSEEEYYESLAAKRAERLPVVSARAKAVKAMEAIIAEAKNALAAGGKENPSDEELKAEIEGNPEKYPEWKKLYAEVERLNGELAAKLKEARDLARERARREGVKVPGLPPPKRGE